MPLFRRLPLSALIDLCRALRHYLGAGLTLRDVFRQQAGKGSAAVRPVAARISAGLESGDDLEDLLRKESAAFPPLFTALATVGEQTGMLPEVFRELEDYFRLQQRLRRQFLALITWPAIQLFAAIFVVAGLIWILGLLGGAYDPIGLGTGGDRALLFLCGAFGLLGAVFGLYLGAKRVLGAGVLDGILLRLPVVGPCLQALAVTRFCLALRLTLETAMPIARALRLSFRATGNGAFEAATETAQKSVKSGEELTAALAETRLFPETFQHVIAVGEESGRLTEVLEQQGQQYAEESERRLKVLAAAAGGAVWVIVAGIIIFCIFRIALSYVGMIDEAARAI
ncbi:MAG TPA: type II secretion system F family protein [Gemmataceae bacterium]|nr:type II secretion system F family protein [Gemmataceae bacterium]